MNNSYLRAELAKSRVVARTVTKIVFAQILLGAIFLFFTGISFPWGDMTTGLALVLLVFQDMSCVCAAGMGRAHSSLVQGAICERMPKK
jgi:hypothetical protein